MADESTGGVSVERLLGGELATAAEKTLVGVWYGAFHPTLAAHLATAHGLLELYWDLRHQRLAPPATGDSLGRLIRHLFGMDDGSVGGPFDAEPRAVPGGIDVTSWVEELLGSDLSAVTGAEPVDAFSPELAVRLATAQVLLALCWELRHQRPDGPARGDDAALEWVSVLLSASAGLDHGPDDFAVPGGPGTPRTGSGIHHL
jgi:hypothetical protein